MENDGGGLVCERGADAGYAREEVKVPEGRACSDAVIAKQYALGQQLGIPGTPMIVVGDGESLGEYMAPDKLLAALDEYAAEHTNGMSGKHSDSDSRPVATGAESLYYPRHSLRR